MISAASKLDQTADLIRQELGIAPSNDQMVMGIRSALSNAVRANLIKVEDDGEDSLRNRRHDR